MPRKLVCVLMLLLPLIGLLAAAFNIQPVKASETIYIRADGTIDPPTAPISTVDNITYTFTGDIDDSIVVERDNIVVDGAGYTLQGTNADESRGTDVTGRSNVTIQNTNIKNYWYGIYLDSSSSNSISADNITNNEYGIRLYSSLSNSISGNSITSNNWEGIVLVYSSGNSISGNNITANNEYGIDLWSSSSNSVSGSNIANNWYGVRLDSSSSNNSVCRNNITANNEIGVWLYYSSSGNSISGNNIANNGYGIVLDSSNHNSVFHNNFINNTQQVISDSVNVWDIGYPSGGNYWSDYTGIDANSDGIGDTSHVIDDDNQDRYPLMHPWSSLSVHNMNTGLGYVAIQEAIKANETLDGHTIFVEAGIYYENVVVDKTVSLIGENRETTIIDGKGIGNVVSITVYNVTVSDFKIQNSGTEYTSGIYFFNASSTLGNVTVRNNNITNNYYGVNVFSSFNVLLVGNNISNNERAGVNLEQSFRNTVINNNVTANIRFGIVLYCADHNTLSDNTMKNNEYGIYVHCSSNNKIYHNNFINNSNQTYVEGYMNIWDDGYPSGGNYWSDYGGADLYKGPYQNETGRDGIGDIPCCRHIQSGQLSSYATVCSCSWRLESGWHRRHS